MKWQFSTMNSVLSGLLAGSCCYLAEPPSLFLLFFRKGALLQVSGLQGGSSCKSPRKTPSCRSARGCACTMKARTRLHCAFLQWQWQNTLMLFPKAWRTLIYAQKDACFCTTNQSGGASELRWLKPTTHHGQELTGVQVPLLCTGGTTKMSWTATSLPSASLQHQQKLSLGDLNNEQYKK